MFNTRKRITVYFGPIALFNLLFLFLTFFLLHLSFLKAIFSSEPDQHLPTFHLSKNSAYYIRITFKTKRKLDKSENAKDFYLN